MGEKTSRHSYKSKAEMYDQNPLYMSFRELRVVITFVEKYNRSLSISCHVGEKKSV